MSRSDKSSKPLSRTGRISHRRTAATLLLCLAFFGAGCSSNPGPQREEIPQRPESHILLIGLDGFEWNVALPMVKSGDLPVLRSLMERGAYGEMRTITPTTSPVIWTSIATGKVPANHGILDLVLNDPNGERVRPYYSTDRTSKAIWNIHSDFDSKVHSIGWWKTYPVEPVNGLMVSQLNGLFSFFETGRGVYRGITRPGEARQVYPVERHRWVMNIADSTQAVMPEIEPKIFGKFNKDHSLLGLRFWESIKWVLSLDAMHYRIALEELARKEQSNLMMVYLRGADVVAHSFWRFAYPDGYKIQPTADELENYSRMVPAYYKHLDSLIGLLIQQADPETTIFIISDHGMEHTNLDQGWEFRAPARESMSGGHETAPPAFFLAAGPNIAPSAQGPIDALMRSELQEIGSVMDVTPTLLALAGLPVGEDMDGSVLTSVIARDFLDRFPPRYIPTHDLPGWRNRLFDLERDPDEEKDRLEELRSLGYID
jgi:hypothetical protein